MTSARRTLTLALTLDLTLTVTLTLTLTLALPLPLTHLKRAGTLSFDAALRKLGLGCASGLVGVGLEHGP